MGKPKNGENEDMGVVENKNVPGNGLTDTVSPEEEPLRKKGGMLKGVLKKDSSKPSEKIQMDDEPVTKGDPSDPSDPDPDDPGPSVSDNESDGEGGRRNRRQRKDFLGSWAHKCRLTPKRGLIYILFCALVIFILFFILLLLAVLWPSGPARPTCKTSQCHHFSSQILAGLNSSTGGPCHDFWEFSCGGWFQAHPLPKSEAYWDTDAVEELKIKDKFRTILNTLPPSMSNEANSFALKMKKFYDSCTQLDYIEIDDWKRLQKIITDLGGWDGLKSTDYRGDDFDFPRTLKRIHEEHLASPFFQISVVPDFRDPSRNIIKIEPAGLSLPHRSYYFEHNGPFAAAFQKFAKQIVSALGMTSGPATQFAEKIFNFERRIAEQTPDPKELRDPITSFHILSVQELNKMTTRISWGDLLTALFPHGNVNDQTEVFTTSSQYIKDVSSIISSTDNGILNTYLMWHLTQKYIPYLSKEFRQINEMLREESTGSSEGRPRWEYCVGETMKNFQHATDYLLSLNSKNRAARIEKIDEMFDTMRQNIINRVSTSTKFDDSMRNFFLDKLRLMTIQIGTPVQNRTLLTEIYLSLKVQKSEFFVNVLSVTDFQIHVQQKHLAHPNKGVQILHAMAKSPFKIQFLESSNKVIVPESILQREILDLEDNHLPLLFGSIGVQLSHALAMSFSPEQGLFFANGEIMSERDPKAQELRDIIDSKRTCLSSFFTNIRLDDEPYIEQTSLDTTMHLAGIQIALDTLRIHDASEGFETLPGLETYSPEALFFLAYGQSQCSVQTMRFHELEHTTFASLSHDHRVKGVLRQLLGFTEAFECSKSSEMYADFSCGYII